MIEHLKKYWIFLLIAFIGFNYVAFYFLSESIGISDAVEHVESERVIRKLKQKKNFYTLFADAVLILDFSVILLLVFINGRKIIQVINRK